MIFNASSPVMIVIFHDVLQEAEEGAETAIDPGGDAVSGATPTNQAVDDEGGGQAAATEADGASGEQVEVEEVSARRPSLQASGGVSEEQEGEESKLREEAGSADSEQVTTETDGEEGIQLSVFHFC